MRNRWTPLSVFRGFGRVVRQGRTIRIERADRVEIELVDRNSAWFFLDEDPVEMRRRVAIRVAGMLDFVPGPEYAWPASLGGTA
jgi:hypothetical protein